MQLVSYAKCGHRIAFQVVQSEKDIYQQLLSFLKAPSH